jgi:hypothetical protein
VCAVDVRALLLDQAFHELISRGDLCGSPDSTPGAPCVWYSAYAWLGAAVDALVEMRPGNVR